MIPLADSHARILAPVAELDYFHTGSAILRRDLTPLEVWNLAMQDPQPLMKLAFRIRDRISALFGVHAIGGFSGNRAQTVAVGDRLDFFLVEYVDDRTLVLTERDRHLDVMTCISTDGPRVSITSSVRTHNWFGRVYMIPVGIAHRLIVRRMLRKLQRKLS